ncbi:HAD family hydrolase [Catelliglobosispora koreensis]|uniref:HAD family hydrolase n=1 Tax=Catelliglobosispora koreensis TaxID=129052 RepID=UPI0012F92D2A|nr:HAD hydrolase-like protein [Catelliglobosispora koreensis]
MLLDFDGPVCSVFAGLPDTEVANRLRKVLRDKGVNVSDDVEGTNDPMAVLEFAAGQLELVPDVEDVLIAGERQAVLSAEPTPFATDFMAAVRASGKRLAIVSNNSASAIRDYLTIVGAVTHVEFIAGRAYGRPDLMKPHVFPVREALRALGMPAGTAVLIGDSVSDIEVSNRAGVASIGYANKPGKAERLHAAGATAIVGDPSGMLTLLTALSDSAR